MFLRVRGWLVSNKKGTICISYRRIGDCLCLLGDKVANDYFMVSALVDHLFRVLNSREIWPVMPFEEGEFKLCLFAFVFQQTTAI